MGNKSFVTLEQQVCIVCGQPFETGNLLLDRRLQERFEMLTTTGWGICPEHMKMYDDGYIALVGIDEKKSRPDANGNLTQETAWRTGSIAHLRSTVFEKVILRELPMFEGQMRPMVFVDEGVIERLQEMQGG